MLLAVRFDAIKNDLIQEYLYLYLYPFSIVNRHQPHSIGYVQECTTVPSRAIDDTTVHNRPTYPIEKAMQANARQVSEVNYIQFDTFLKVDL